MCDNDTLKCDKFVTKYIQCIKCDKFGTKYVQYMYTISFSFLKHYKKCPLEVNYINIVYSIDTPEGDTGEGFLSNFK